MNLITLISTALCMLLEEEGKRWYHFSEPDQEWWDSYLRIWYGRDLMPLETDIDIESLTPDALDIYHWAKSAEVCLNSKPWDLQRACGLLLEGKSWN